MISSHFNPAVGLYPAGDMGIRVLKTGCSLWHCLSTPFLTYHYDLSLSPINRTKMLCISSTLMSTCSTTVPYRISVGTFFPYTPAAGHKDTAGRYVPAGWDHLEHRGGSH